MNMLVCERYKIVKKCGAGAFGEIFKGTFSCNHF